MDLQWSGAPVGNRERAQEDLGRFLLSRVHMCWKIDSGSSACLAFTLTLARVKTRCQEKHGDQCRECRVQKFHEPAVQLAAALRARMIQISPPTMSASAISRTSCLKADPESLAVCDLAFE